ncbi:unnamed protein product [Closterium sp. Yama58-4]|nr:unnamed protein product [Closterium sp. Yama58-4]
MAGKVMAKTGGYNGNGRDVGPTVFLPPPSPSRHPLPAPPLCLPPSPSSPPPSRHPPPLIPSQPLLIASLFPLIAASFPPSSPRAPPAIRTMTGHKAAPVALDLYSAGGLCASLSPADGTARVWDPRQKEAAHVFRGMGAGDAGEGGGAVGGGGAEGRGAGAGGGAESAGGKGGKTVGCVRFSPDGRWVVAGGQDGRIKRGSPPPPPSLRAPVPPRVQLFVLAQGRLFAERRASTLFDLAQGRLFAQLAGHAGAVAALDFHPQELLLASAARDRTVRWWDLESFDCVDYAPPGAGGTTALAFAPQGDALFVPCTDHLKRASGGVGRGERGDRGSGAWCSSEGGWWGREGKGGRGGVVAAVVLGRDGDKGVKYGGYTTGGDTSIDDECTSHRLPRGTSVSHGATTTTTAAAAGHTASQRGSRMHSQASPCHSPPSSSPSNPNGHSPARTAPSSSATPVTVTPDVVSAMASQGSSSMAGGGGGGAPSSVGGACGTSAAVQCLGVDGCAALVPILGGLLASAQSSRVHAALLLLRALLRCYSDSISAARSAVHSPGVDLHMEMRLQRCAECAEAFRALTPRLQTLLHTGPKENCSLATQVHMLTSRLAS